MGFHAMHLAIHAALCLKILRRGVAYGLAPAHIYDHMYHSGCFIERHSAEMHYLAVWRRLHLKAISSVGAAKNCRRASG